ncbi:unnamed protein product [Acanthoscelides obtectus]|uniref:Uncharacterized protein n=1 Tax=Acanthoscelides obtectus TaxID=200917 RepID=A0A9P0M617_ACAOB|nr:unnamed protein product [Acanthoscelides obtectus]CAK1671943.1 hypothetical protein AOBTE_LOCUS28553 [Acanthoscelides obtectus]
MTSFALGTDLSKETGSLEQVHQVESREYCIH